MMQHQKFPLDEVADVIRGVTFSRSEGEMFESGGTVPVIRAGNVQDRLLLNQDLVWVPKGKVSKKQFIKKNDLVMCTSSGSAELVGKCARSEVDWFGSFGAFCAGIRAKEKVCDSGYLFHFLRSPSFKNWCRKSGGVNIKNIRKSELEEFEIPLPPLTEQRRIAAILDKADAIRRKRQQAIRLTEDVLCSVFLDMFGDPVTNPKGWELRSIENLLADKRNAIRTGPFGSQLKVSEFVEKGVPVLGIDNIVTNEFKWTKQRCLPFEKYEEFQRYQVFPDDVIVTIMGTTGRVVVAPQDLPECMSTKHLCVFTLDKSYADPVFIWGTLMFDQMVRNQAKVSGGGAIMEGWNLGIIKSLMVRVPPIKLQKQFRVVIEQIKKSKEAELKAANLENDLFNSLVQRAFRGDL